MGKGWVAYLSPRAYESRKQVCTNVWEEFARDGKLASVLDLITVISETFRRQRRLGGAEMGHGVYTGFLSGQAQSVGNDH